MDAPDSNNDLDAIRAILGWALFGLVFLFTLFLCAVVLTVGIWW